MVNYQNGKIYKIVCDITDFVYIGSTCGPLNKRWNEHLSAARKTKQKRNIYERMKNIGIEYFHIVLIKFYPCNNREELFRKER